MVSPTTKHLLTKEDFAELFGIEVSELSHQCQQMIQNHEFSYRVLNKNEQKKMLLEVLKKIDSNTLTVSGEWRKPDWEAGWSDNLERFVENDFDLSQLVPRYLPPMEILRYKGEYIESLEPEFQLQYYNVFRHFLFQTYFQEVEQIYEFGCGTGYNLAIMARLFPQKQLFGLDWAQASINLVNEIGRSQNFNMSGHHFDMFNPEQSIAIKPNSAVLTLNSLEQIGTNHEALIQYLIRQKPAFCIHAEPLVELYNEDDLLDYIGIKYHRARGYLEGFIPRLKALEDEGIIEISKLHRIPFGNQYHDGYSYIVWRPL